MVFNHTIYMREYRKTKKSVITKAYQGMRRRVSGEQAHHIKYMGMELLPREDFIKWAKDNKVLDKLYKEWYARGCEYKYTPSVDRLDPRQGYYLENMDWCTISENTKRMLNSKH